MCVRPRNCPRCKLTLSTCGHYAFIRILNTYTRARARLIHACMCTCRAYRRRKREGQETASRAAPRDCANSSLIAVGESRYRESLRISAVRAHPPRHVRPAVCFAYGRDHVSARRRQPGRETRYNIRIDINLRSFSAYESYTMKLPGASGMHPKRAADTRVFQTTAILSNKFVAT